MNTVDGASLAIEPGFCARVVLVIVSYAHSILKDPKRCAKHKSHALEIIKQPEQALKVYPYSYVTFLPNKSVSDRDLTDITPGIFDNFVGGCSDV